MTYMANSRNVLPCPIYFAPSPICSPLTCFLSITGHVVHHLIYMVMCRLVIHFARYVTAATHLHLVNGLGRNLYFIYKYWTEQVFQQHIVTAKRPHQLFRYTSDFLHIVTAKRTHQVFRYTSHIWHIVTAKRPHQVFRYTSHIWHIVTA